jgi:hypothetical protein
MNLPEGIALGTLFIGGSTVAVTAIKQRGLNALNGKLITEKICDIKHQAVERELSSINGKLDIIIKKLVREV